MPTSVAIVGSVHSQIERIPIKRMLDALIPAAKSVPVVFEDANITVGRHVYANERAETKQDHYEWNGIHLWLCGELYDTKSLSTNLLHAQHAQYALESQAATAAQLALHLYLEVGDELAKQLNGVFLLVIWDSAAQQLTIINDRLGLIPLYYAQPDYAQPGTRLLFATGMRALLADPALGRAMDAVAIAQVLSFETVLGTRTLLSQVRQLSPASILKWQSSILSIKPYWRLHFPAIYSPRTQTEWTQEFSSKLQQAVGRQASIDSEGGSSFSGLSLSGGVRSRVLLAVLQKVEEKNGRPSPQTFTFGQQSSKGRSYAQRVANKLNTKHHFIELKPESLIESIQQGVQLSDGMLNATYMHLLPTAGEQAKHVSLLYTGMGGALLGLDSRLEWIARYDPMVARQAITETTQVLFRDRPLRQRMTPSFFHQIEEGFEADFANLCSDAEASVVADAVQQATFSGITVRRLRLIAGLITHHLPLRMPFTDIDLIDFATSLPSGMRSKPVLFWRVLASAMEALANVADDDTGEPLITSIRDFIHRVDEQTRWQLVKHLHWQKAKPQPASPYVNYGEWMRGPLRNWLETQLLSQRHLSRGYLIPEVVREVVSRHMHGADYSRELGMMLALELWQQTWIDRETE